MNSSVSKVTDKVSRRKHRAQDSGFVGNFIPRLVVRLLFGLLNRRAFYQQLRVFSLSNTPIAETIAELRIQAEEGKQKILWYVLNDIQNGLRAGLSFAETLREWCPQSDLLLLTAGGSSNKLMADAISRILKRSLGISEMWSALIFVMVEPSIVLFGTYGLVIWMSTTFLQKLLAEVPGVNADEFTGLAHQIVVVGEFGKGIGALFPPALFIAAMMLIFWSFPRWTGSVRKYFDVIPPWSIYRAVQGAGWMQSFAMLAQSKVAYQKIMKDTATLASPWLKERIITARQLMTNPGLPVGEALWASGYGFPSKKVALNLKAFGARPGFEDALGEISDEWFRSTINSVKVASMILGIVTMLVSTIAILWVFQSSNALETQLTTILKLKYG